MFDPEADAGLLNFERARVRDAWRAETAHAAVAGGAPRDALSERLPAARARASLQSLAPAPPREVVPSQGEGDLADAGTSVHVAVPGRTEKPLDPEAPLRHARLGFAAAVVLALLLLWIRQRNRR